MIRGLAIVIACTGIVAGCSRGTSVFTQATVDLEAEKAAVLKRD